MAKFAPYPSGMRGNRHESCPARIGDGRGHRDVRVVGPAGERGDGSGARGQEAPIDDHRVNQPHVGLGWREREAVGEGQVLGPGPEGNRNVQVGRQDAVRGAPSAGVGELSHEIRRARLLPDQGLLRR